MKIKGLSAGVWDKAFGRMGWRMAVVMEIGISREMRMMCRGSMTLQIQSEGCSVAVVRIDVVYIEVCWKVSQILMHINVDC